MRIAEIGPRHVKAVMRHTFSKGFWPMQGHSCGKMGPNGVHSLVAAPSGHILSNAEERTAKWVKTELLEHPELFLCERVFGWLGGRDAPVSL
jgi:hypothetical protein